MKKLIALLLASVIVLSFCGCESGPSSEEINAAGLIMDDLDAVFLLSCMQFE